MPIYEYKCRRCGRAFELLLLPSITAACPECDSEELERTISLFAVSTDGTKQAASSAGRRRNRQLQRDFNDAEIAYHKKHDDH